MPPTAPPDPTQIILFLLGSGVVLMVAAFTIAGWKHKVLVWGLIGGGLILFLMAATWQRLPALVSVLNAAVSAGAPSFLAVIVGLVAIVTVHVRVRRLQIPGAIPTGLETATSVIAQDYDDSALRAQIASLSKKVTGYEGQVALLENSVLKIPDLEAAVAELDKRIDDSKNELAALISEQGDAVRATEARSQMHAFNVDNKLMQYVAKVQPLHMTTLKGLVLLAAYSNIAQLLDEMRSAAQSPDTNLQFFSTLNMLVTRPWQSAVQALSFADVPKEQIDKLRNTGENPLTAPHDEGVPDDFKQIYRYEYLLLSRLEKKLADQITQSTGMIAMMSGTLRL